MKNWQVAKIGQLATKQEFKNLKKNLGWLRPDRPRNTLTAHALKTKLKSSDAKKTRKPPTTPEMGAY